MGGSGSWWWRLGLLHDHGSVVCRLILRHNVTCMTASRDPSQKGQPTVDATITAKSPFETDGKRWTEKRQDVETHFEACFNWLDLFLFYFSQKMKIVLRFKKN